MQGFEFRIWSLGCFRVSGLGFGVSGWGGSGLFFACSFVVVTLGVGIASNK